MDDLQRELGGLETQLVETTPDSRVIDELGAMRRHLDEPRESAPFRLPKLRIASPCKERWDAMRGDDRVRVCDGCNRPVFNLSEMTRDQAEAVLATRGVKPCVRFYRRADGTVKTADCPPTARRSHRLTVIAAGTLLGSSPAFADPEPGVPPVEPPERELETMGEPVAADPCEDRPAEVVDDKVWLMGDIAPDPDRPAVEWSTWARVGFGLATRPPAFAARMTTPGMPVESATLTEGALGLDVSLGVTRGGKLRVGGWVEARTTSSPVLGGELIVAMPSSRRGGFGIVLRGGGNGEVATGALALGFSSPDRWLGAGHRPGLRMVTSMTRSVDEPRDWSVTFGFELDLLGAIGVLVDR